MVRLAETLLHLFWPISCPLCGRLGVSVCPACIRTLVEHRAPLCAECGARFPCSFHASFPIYSVAPYPGESQRLIVAMKYGGVRALAFEMGKVIGETLPPLPQALLVPIPLHLESDRDYNQALGMAKGIASQWQTPIGELLRWKKRSARQATLSAAERLARSHDSFTLTRACPATPLVLVDDISTTGATLRAAAQTLRQGGGYVAAALVWGQVAP